MRSVIRFIASLVVGLCYRHRNRLPGVRGVASTMARVRGCGTPKGLHARDDLLEVSRRSLVHGGCGLCHNDHCRRQWTSSVVARGPLRHHLTPLTSLLRLERLSRLVSPSLSLLPLADRRIDRRGSCERPWTVTTLLGPK